MKKVQVNIAPVRRASQKKNRRFRKQIWERDSIAGKIKCCWCPKMMARNEFTIEHIQPLSMGGTYEMKNLAAACKPCNEEFGRLTERIVQKKRDMADCALTRKIAREKATLETLNRRFALP